MALIDCKECGSRVSDKADVCIKCGCPIEDEVIVKSNISKGTQGQVHWTKFE